MVLANLLLVGVTAVNVWLTRKTLTALREASLREREARHLQDIKDNVVARIVSWISGTVIGRFTDRSLPLLVVAGGYGGRPREVTHTVDDPFNPRQRLRTPADSKAPDWLATWTSLEGNRVPKSLYDNAKCEHFPDQLKAFDDLLQEVQVLIDTFVSFAKDCAERVAQIDILPALRSEDENSMPEFANVSLWAAECIQCFLNGEENPYVRPEAGGPFSSLLTAQNQTVAKATQLDKLKRWQELSSKEIRSRWMQCGLAQRVENLLQGAARVRANVENLSFTHSLGVDCELVSGRK